MVKEGLPRGQLQIPRLDRRSTEIETRGGSTRLICFYFALSAAQNREIWRAISQPEERYLIDMLGSLTQRLPIKTDCVLIMAKSWQKGGHNAASDFSKYEAE